MACGDHIRVKRGLYWHHGIDCGDGQVIHYTGEPFRRSRGLVERTDLETFARGGNVEIIAYKQCAMPEIVVRRAESRLNESSYDLLDNNCEHFARWCKTGWHESRQVRRVLRVVKVLGVVAGGVAMLAAKRFHKRRGEF